jgi:hypothetical protein
MIYRERERERLNAHKGDLCDVYIQRERERKREI